MHPNNLPQDGISIWHTGLIPHHERIISRQRYRLDSSTKCTNFYLVDHVLRLISLGNLNIAPHGRDHIAVITEASIENITRMESSMLALGVPIEDLYQIA